MIDCEAEITFNRQVNHDTWIMGLSCPEIAAGVQPGQFVMIRAGCGIDPLLRRPFSVCGVEGDHFKVLYRVVGKGTGLMTAAKPGESLQVLGPLGKSFVLPEEEVMPVLVAGGIGIAPLFFLAQSLGARKMDFMMGFRSGKDVIRLEHGKARGHTVSISTEDGAEGHPGLVTDLLETFLKTHRGIAVNLYACGPRPMLKRIAESAIEASVPCQVSLESAMACGFGVCQGCAVKASPGSSHPFHYVCQDGPVFPAEAIDWEAW